MAPPRRRCLEQVTQLDKARFLGVVAPRTSREDHLHYSVVLALKINREVQSSAVPTPKTNPERRRRCSAKTRQERRPYLALNRRLQTNQTKLLLLVRPAGSLANRLVVCLEVTQRLLAQREVVLSLAMRLLPLLALLRKQMQPDRVNWFLDKRRKNQADSSETRTQPARQQPHPQLRQHLVAHRYLVVPPKNRRPAACLGQHHSKILLPRSARPRRRLVEEVCFQTWAKTSRQNQRLHPHRLTELRSRSSGIHQLHPQGEHKALRHRLFSIPLPPAPILQQNRQLLL